jgi:hypothetical protein
LALADAVALLEGQDAVVIAAEDGRIKLNVNARVLIDLSDELLGDRDAARAGALLLRAEEAVRLLDQLTAKARVLVEHDHVRALLGCGERGHQAGRPTANDGKISLEH